MPDPDERGTGHGPATRVLVAVLKSLAGLVPVALIAWLWPEFNLIGTLVSVIATTVLALAAVARYLPRRAGPQLAVFAALFACAVVEVIAIPSAIEDALRADRGVRTAAVVTAVRAGGRSGGFDCSYRRLGGSPIPDEKPCTSHVGDRAVLLVDRRGQLPLVLADRPDHAAAMTQVTVAATVVLVLVVGAIVARGERRSSRRSETGTEPGPD